jgi:hypothetical protein
MFPKISIKDFKVMDPNTYVLAADVFYVGLGERVRNNKVQEYCSDILDRLYDGKFCGLITDMEFNRVKNVIGEGETSKFFYSKLKNSQKVICFKIGVSDCLDEYRNIPAYSNLSNLMKYGSMHMPNMTSIIAAIEIDVPIVSQDPHFYSHQNNIVKAYRERHRDDRVKVLTERLINRGSKTRTEVKDMVILTPQDFCKNYLK